MAKRVHYPTEVKWKAVNIRLAGYTKRETMKALEIENDMRLETWMRWYLSGVLIEVKWRVLMHLYFRIKNCEK